MRGLAPLRGQNGRILLGGSFITTSGATDDPTSFRGVGFTVTKPATGRYLVTFRDPVSAFDAIIPSIAVETAGTALFCDVDEDSITTTAFEINIEDDADTLTDDAGSRVSFIALARVKGTKYGET